MITIVENIYISIPYLICHFCIVIRDLCTYKYIPYYLCFICKRCGYILFEKYAIKMSVCVLLCTKNTNNFYIHSHNMHFRCTLILHFTFFICVYNKYNGYTK